MLDKLPTLPLFKIAEFLKIETPFRDKVDIAVDAASLALVSKSVAPLVNELIYHLDPISTEPGRLSTIVKKNIQHTKRRLITASTAKHTWGLSDDEIGNAVLIKLQDAKKKSSIKFNYSVERLGAYTSMQQQQRYHVLSKILEQNSITLRPDSKFCSTYICTGRGNPDEIVKVLKEMDFYHTFTDYNKFFDIITAKYSCEYGYYDRDQISNDAKQRALEAFIEANPSKKYIIPPSLHKYIS